MNLFQLPVAFQTQTIRMQGIEIVYPRLVGLANQQAEAHINQAIVQLVYDMQREQTQVQTGTNMEVTGHYEIKNNQRGIVSLTLSNYAYSYPMAHGFTTLRSLTCDVNTGKIFTLSELFKPGSNYEAVLSGHVAAQIKQRDLPTLNGPVSVQPNQEYYLADKALVLYYQLYQITPYYVGFPMFPVSVYAVQSMAVEEGPLAKLSVDIA